MNQTSLLQSILESKETQFILFLIIGGIAEYLRGLPQRTKAAREKQEAERIEREARDKETENERRAQQLREEEQKFSRLNEDLTRRTIELDKKTEECERLTVENRSLEADKLRQRGTIQSCKLNEHLTRLKIKHVSDLLQPIADHYGETGEACEDCSERVTQALMELKQDIGVPDLNDETERTHN